LATFLIKIKEIINKSGDPKVAAFIFYIRTIVAFSQSAQFLKSILL
jgi:hypothetical protein